MATNTPNFNLIKPGADDFVDIADLNTNADIIDYALRNIDGGNFTDVDPVEIHNATALTHTNMTVEGGSVAIMGDSIGTLEEHVIDENAHQNIILDDNNTL